MKRRNTKLYKFLIASTVGMSLLTGCSNNGADQKSEAPTKQEVVKEEAAKVEVTVTGVDAISIAELTEFDPLAGVSAKGTDGKDVTADIEVKGEVNTLKPGTYELTYTVKGTDVSVKRVITVTGVEATLANGTYNFKFASAELRNTLMAAAEDYLLHNQFAGVPLFANAGYSLYSGRMQLPVKEYVPIMGYGTDFATMSADDSKVVMEDGKPGKAGEHTFRSAIGQNPSAWNQWKYDDQTTSDVMVNYYGTLYDYEFNTDKTGYVLNPSMAADNPVPIEGKQLDSGKLVSKKWQIKIKDGLEWKFHPKTDISMIKDTTINAVDFYETYKLALEQKWFRAVSGGGDFCTSGTKITNAQEFVDGLKTWEDVGIKLIDDNTIEFEFVDDQSEWNVKYFLSSFVMTPIQTELYQALGDKFGTDEKTIAYHGIYYVDYYESDKIIRYKKNDKFHNTDKYSYTGKTMTVIADAEMRFQEFLAGKLDGVSLPATNYEEYKSHPGLKHIPGTTTYRMMINGTGTKENQLAKFPESQWTPEPILASQDFKMAMFHAMDRKKLATEVMKTSQPMMYLFSEAYVVEAETGERYRSTEQGKSVGTDLSPSTYGYNLDAAKAYYEKALDKLVADGVYKSGDEIKIEFYYFSGSETQALMASYIKDAMEAAFNSEKHNIKVKVETAPKEFPGIYYDCMMLGAFDTAIGGISGSVLDAASFLDTYCTDNRSGFSLNWGVDTSIPEVTVAYENYDGELVKELWSYDALSSALNGEVKVAEGKEVKAESK